MGLGRIGFVVDLVVEFWFVVWCVRELKMCLGVWLLVLMWCVNFF